MANRYWVGGTGDWDDSSTTHWSDTSGGSSGASIPTSSDDITFDNNSHNDNYTVTVVDTAYCADITMDKPDGVGKKITFDTTFYDLHIYGILNFTGGSAGITMPFDRKLQFKATAGTKTIYTNGVSLDCDIKIDGSGGTFQLLSDLTINRLSAALLTLELSNGTFDANSKKVKITSFETIIKSLNFYDLEVIGSSSYYSRFCFQSNCTISNSFVAKGDSNILRLLISSDRLNYDECGTQRTITSASNTFENLDIEDIKGAGAGSWDLSSITGLSGDCGGNTDITLTTADDWYWHSDTGNFSDYTHWYTATNGGGSQMASTRTPLPQDTCYFDANSFDSSGKELTFDMKGLCNIDLTGTTNTPKFIFPASRYLYGSLKLIEDITITAPTVIYLCGRGTYTLDVSGHNFDNISLNSGSGTWNLGSDITTDDGWFNLVHGSIDAKTYNVTCASTYVFSTKVARIISLGTGTWEVKQVWTSNYSANTTFNCNTSTIKYSGVLTVDKAFSNAANFTFYNFWNHTTGDYNVLIYDTTTFNDFKIDAGRKMKFTNSKTITVNTFTALGTSDNHITISNTSATTHATLAKAGGGTITGCDYIDIQEITGSPDVTWYIGANSTDTDTTCTNIYLSDPPASGNTVNFFHFINN